MILNFHRAFSACVLAELKEMADGYLGEKLKESLVFSKSDEKNLNSPLPQDFGGPFKKKYNKRRTNSNPVVNLSCIHWPQYPYVQKTLFWYFWHFLQTVLVGILATELLIKFSINAPARQRIICTSIWAPHPHVGNEIRIPGSWLCPIPVLIGEWAQWMEDLLSSPSELFGFSKKYFSK